MDQPMSDINVALTTTKYAASATGESVDAIVRAEMPVCAADMCMGAFGFNPSEKERFEDYWSKICMSMAKKVVVDTEKMAVYIGDEGSWLVEYVVDEQTKYRNEFFERWKQIHMMLFEFTLKDMRGNPVFALKGIWDKDRWAHLDIFPANTCTIV